MPKVYIVILQYNQSAHTLKCLESVAKLTYPNYEVVVVDNGSETAHLKNVEYWIDLNKAKSYKLIANNSNTGYGAGNNLGIKYALDHGADYVLILNNDTIIAPDFLDKIPQAYISGPIIHKIKWFFPGGIPSSAPIDSSIKYISGAAMLVKKEVFEKIGFFDESYFLYFEDADFCFRARKVGFLLSDSTAKLIHDESATVSEMGMAKKLTINARNARKFFSRFAPWYIRALLPLWYPVAILYARIYGHYRDRMRVN